MRDVFGLFVWLMLVPLILGLIVGVVALAGLVSPWTLVVSVPGALFGVALYVVMVMQEVG